MNQTSAKVGSLSSMHVDCAKVRNGGPRRIEGSRGAPITFTFDGQSIEAFEGETIAAALLASGVRTLRETTLKSEPRGLFCNMGICFDCLVEVDGNANQRACQRPVANGLKIKSQHADPLESHE